MNGPYYGYHGRLLRIDLTHQSSGVEAISTDDLRLFWGGRGLGALFLFRELPPGTAPLSPENPLIFSTGPFCSAGVPGSNRFLLHTKSPLTQGYLFSVSGGKFGADFKSTGYDVMIIHGKSKQPVYLLIDGDNVSFKDAAHLWGLDTEDTQGLIRSEGRDPELGITCIGPAGENGVLYSCLINERRALGRGGGGAVMGSKNLKAIALRGKAAAPIFDSGVYGSTLKAAFKELQENPMTSKVIPTFGSVSTLALLKESGTLPANNWQTVSGDEAVALFGDRLRGEFLVKDLACAPGCPVRCSKLYLVRKGPYAGSMSEGPDYETAYSFGSCCGIYDYGAIIHADLLCDRLGLDTISAGVSIAFAMECAQKGIIPPEPEKGLNLQFGNGEAVIKLLHQIAYRTGFGNILAQGTMRMAEQFGKGSEAFAMHTKGMELGGYDPRGMKGMSLVYGCGPRGGCHHSGGYPVFLELKGEIDRFAEAGKAALVAGTRNRRVAICDSASLCAFVSVGLKDETVAALFSSITGFPVEAKDLYIVGDRISCLERVINAREGVRREDDKLPERLTEEPIKTGPSQGQKVQDFEKMKDEFYQVCGWDLKTGIPTRERVEKLGIPWALEGIG
jgi:aldehyde:ferredoxin oxidoreductase